MKPEEAIKQFNEWRESGWSKSETLNTESLILSLKALEKQMPKNPKEDRCPSCSTEVRIFHDIGNPDDCNFWEQTYDFCPDCGQAIEWGDE